jgi:hypothetical protein
MFILRSLLFRLSLLFKIHQPKKLLSSILFHIFFKVSSSHYPSSSKSINQRSSSAAFSSTYSLSEVSFSHYPSASNSTKCSEEEGCHYG